MRGSLGFGLDIRLIGGRGSLDPDTQAFIDRVIADGGTVEDANFLNSFVLDAKANNYWDDIVAAYSPSWGVKGTTTVSDLYSVSGVATDLLQAIATNQPTISSADLNGKTRLTFDGIDNFMKAVAFTFTRPETIAIGGYQSVTWTNNDDVFDGDANITMQLRQQGVTPEMDMFGGALLSGITNVAVGSDYHIRSLFGNIGSAFQRDAEAEVAGATGISDGGGFTLGAGGDGLSKFGNVKVGMVVLLMAAEDANYDAKMTALYNFSKSAYATG